MSTSLPAPSSPAAPGRPGEIEEATNRRFIHPLSRRLVDQLAHTAVTPNQVSVLSVLAAAAGALCYLGLRWPWAALCGFGCQIAWHVLDGADGDLARRTGRASAVGELVDGVCDHLSQALFYIAFAVVLRRAMGDLAWLLAAAAALSHAAQANAYETSRKTYRRWVYGATWMRQAPPGGNVAQRLLARLYIGVSNVFSPGEAALEATMGPAIVGGGTAAEWARALYRERQAPVVKTAAILGGNSRTLVAFASMLAGSPLWFFLFEIVLLNAALAALVLWRGRRNRTLAVAVRGAAQAASAPNCNLARRA